MSRWTGGEVEKSLGDVWITMRASELGISIGTLNRGAHNAITDVVGVRVGHTTLIEGSGPLVVGGGPARTGVTVIQPRAGRVWADPVFAGWHRLNGAGELSGLHWVRESGLLSAPIAITNTHSLGIVRDALIKAEVRQLPAGSPFSAQPVVGETYDGTLNDVNGFLIREEHVFHAVESASSGPVAEGNIGGGTGMICHGFKGGIGTSSRVVGVEPTSYVVGVLVQANHGRRERLRVNGAPVGRMIPPSEVPLPGPPRVDGSIIVVVATDAPVLPHQCDRLAQRAALAIGRTGGLGEHGSGDLIVAFATGNTGLPSEHLRHAPLVHIDMLANSGMTALFEAVVDATEEAILNALLAAETMIGRDNITAYRLPHDRLVAVLRNYSAM